MFNITKRHNQKFILLFCLLLSAVLTEPLSCVYYGLTKLAQVPIGSSILVTGAGIIGNLWSAVLHHVGHRNVIVVEPLAGRRTLNENLGSNTFFEINTVFKINSYLYSRTPHIQTLRVQTRVKYKLDRQKSNKTLLQVEKYAYKTNMAKNTCQESCIYQSRQASSARNAILC